MEKKPIMEMEERMKDTGGSIEDGRIEDDMEFPGFRFHPTDQELVGFYLKRKVERKGFSIDIIQETDVYKHDPWDLPSEARHVVQQGAGEKEWYFFCLRGRKYRNSIRPNRVTGSGFWKATGIDKPIHDGGGESVVGLKKSLVYYRGSAGKGTKTDWMMHEFRLPSSSSADFQDAEIWTVCRIFKRNLSNNRRFQQQKREKRSHQQQQKQSYYGYQHPLYTAGCASMATSFESMTRDLSEASHHNCHQFLLHGGFHSATAPPPDVTTTASASPSALAWSDLTSFASNTWDELGRILDISTDMTTYF